MHGIINNKYIIQYLTYKIIVITTFTESIRTFSGILKLLRFRVILPHLFEKSFDS